MIVCGSLTSLSVTEKFASTLDTGEFVPSGGSIARQGELAQQLVVGPRVDVDAGGLDRRLELIELGLRDAGLRSAALLGDLLEVGDDLRHVRVAVDVDRVGAVDVGRAFVGDVGQPAGRIDAELVEERLES